MDKKKKKFVPLNQMETGRLYITRDKILIRRVQNGQHLIFKNRDWEILKISPSFIMDNPKVRER